MKKGRDGGEWDKNIRSEASNRMAAEAGKKMKSERGEL